jgi:hypothetical protein
MSDQIESRELAEVQGSRTKPSRMRRGIVWVACLSVVGGLSFGLLTAVERAQESAARMH